MFILVDQANIVEPVLNIDQEMMNTLRGNRFYQFGPSFLQNLEESANFDKSLKDFFAESKDTSIHRWHF